MWKCCMKNSHKSLRLEASTKLNSQKHSHNMLLPRTRLIMSKFSIHEIFTNLSISLIGIPEKICQKKLYKNYHQTSISIIADH